MTVGEKSGDATKALADAPSFRQEELLTGTSYPSTLAMQERAAIAHDSYFEMASCRDALRDLASLTLDKENVTMSEIEAVLSPEVSLADRMPHIRTDCFDFRTGSPGAPSASF